MNPTKHISSNIPFARGLVAFATLLTAATLAPAAVTWKNVQFGGFVSQGYLKSTNNNYPVDTKDGTFDFREYAVNASTTFGTHLRVGAQVFGQKFGKYGDDKPILDWAVVDYNFRQEIGVQVGRVKYPRSLQSDVLDADVLRPFIFLPQSLYDTRLRDVQASFDGALVYGTIGAGKSTFDYKVYYGDVPLKTESGFADYFNTSSLFKNPPGVTTIGLDSVAGAALAWSTPLPGLRFAAYYSSVRKVAAQGPFVSVPSQNVSVDFKKLDYTAVSAEFTKEAWTFNGEYLIERGDELLTLPAFIATPRLIQYGNRSYYLSAARRLNGKLEVGAYYSHTHVSYPAAGAPAWTQKRNDWTVSGRYDVTDHLLFKLEVHFIEGTRGIFNVTDISNPTSGLKESMILFAAKTTLSF